MKETSLSKLYHILSSKIDQGHINYVVPDIWNAWNYNGEEMRKLPSSELLVNPYRFYSQIISQYILPRKDMKKEYHTSLSKTNPRKHPKGYLGGDWVKESVLYSTMIRTSTSWDHDRSYSLDLSNFDGIKETGSFVKMLVLLPFLQKMGVTTVYMLPISKYSLKDKKGDLGSPYGVASFYEIDPGLKDSLVGDALTVEEEFSAFVEACHILNLRVIIDIIPRTNAVENDLMKEHPEWFYWIKASEYDAYKVPKVEGIPDTTGPNNENMKTVYASLDVKRHLHMFQNNPKLQNPTLWEEVVKSNKNITDEIISKFDLRIAPAFSDNINDVQPAWTDVTFFRMFLDHPVATSKYLKSKDQPPYILFDTIKSNLFPGAIPNQDLWNTLASIIPYYQDHYGIDGARIDMGHALPKELLEQIITTARKNDPDFAFIAEELNPDNALAAKKANYNIIIGNGFWMQPRIWEKKMHKFIYGAPDIPLPQFACVETHDTARIAARDGGRVLARMSTVFNMLLPNLVPFINSGQELYEIQPMNTGVDCQEKDKFLLDPNDLFYGKLALFDKYAFHYTNPYRWEIADHLDGVKQIREEWLYQVTHLENYLPIVFEEFNTDAIGVSYFNQSTGKCLIVVGNANPYQNTNCHSLIQQLRERSNNQNHFGLLRYATYEMSRHYHEFGDDGSIYFNLGPGEVKIIEL